MELFVWFEGSQHLRAALKYARITDGAPCVIINGTGQMPWLYVDSWDCLLQVTAKIIFVIVLTVADVDFAQERIQLILHPLVKAEVP